jgi:AcrR family transcriptional regulator
MHEPSTSLIERRRRILAAAGDLFAQQPYDVVQMDEIARGAQVAKPTIYRHFGTKEALFGAAVAEALAELKAAAAEIAAREAPALMRFRDLVAIVFRGIGRLKAAIREAEGGGARMGEMGRAAMRREVRAFREVIAGIIEEGIAEGAFAPMDPDLAARMVLGAVRMTADAKGADTAAAVGELLLHGLAGSGARPATSQRSMS